jgi:multiple antibiotic resistance protein
VDAVADFFKDLGLAFIPLFVAMDPIGVLPFILSLTQDMTPAQRSKTTRYALLTALGLGLAFIAIGQGVFHAMGIRIGDFLVAGGLILLVLAIRHLMTGKFVEVQPALGETMVAVVPIGTPLVVGPAVLTTLLLLVSQYSIAAVLVAFALNLAIAWLVFAQANRVVRFLRQGGLRAISQIASLLLAAIAVMMVREGIMELLAL